MATDKESHSGTQTYTVPQHPVLQGAAEWRLIGGADPGATEQCPAAAGPQLGSWVRWRAALEAYDYEEPCEHGDRPESAYSCSSFLHRGGSCKPRLTCEHEDCPDVRRSEQVDALPEDVLEDVCEDRGQRPCPTANTPTHTDTRHRSHAVGSGEVGTGITVRCGAERGRSDHRLRAR